MTTRAEVIAALALPPRAKVTVNLRDVDSLRSYIRRTLDAGEFERGAVVDLVTLAEDAEERGVVLRPETDDPEIAAAVLLEGLLLASKRGTQARSFMWPGDAGREWQRDVEARRDAIQRHVVKHSNGAASHMSR